MISGANEFVQIMGADPTAPGGQFAPGTYSSAPGGTPSSLSPAELAHMQQVNAAANIKSAKSNTATDMMLAFAALLVVGGGVFYATRKK